MQGGSGIDLATLVINLLLNSDVSEGAESAKKSLGDVDKAAQGGKKTLTDWATSMEASGQKLVTLGNNMNKVGTTLTKAVTLPVVAMGTAALKSSIDFEDAFAGVKKTVDATAQEYEAMSKAILEMSNTMPFAATEIAGVAEAAGQLGIAKGDIMDFSEVMLKIGQATDLAAADAATSLARFANITGMSASNYENLGSTIVALGNNFAATESEIVAMGMRLAAAGNQIGLTEAETMGFAAALRSVGIEAEAGGTAFSKVMLEIDIAASKGGKAIQGYADVAGMSAQDFAKAWEQDAAGALVAFIEGLGRVQDEGGNLALVLEELGYTEVRTRDALMRSAGASDMVAESVRTANAAWGENIALQEEVDKRNETTASKLQVLKNKAQNTMIQFGDAMLPIANQAIDSVGGVIDKFSEMDDGMRQSIIFTAGGAALAGPFLKVIGNIIKTVGNMPKTIKTVGADFKTFLGVLSNPVVLGIAGAAAVIGGIAYALGTAKREADAFKKSIAEFDFNLDEGNINRLMDKMQAGKDAYTVYADVKLEMTTQTDELWNQVNDALADGKFSKREFRAITNAMNEMVDGDIEAAKAAMKEKVDGYVDWMTMVTVGEKVDMSALLTSITGAFNQIAIELQGLDFLTPDQISQIMAIAIDPGVIDFNAALAEIGIADPAAQAAIIAAVQPNIDELNSKLSDLGILDENTRGAVIQKVGEQLSLLSTDLNGQELDPGTATALADILTNFAVEADAAMLAAGIPVLEDASKRDTLIKAAMKGPEELTAALANRNVFTEAEASELQKILDPTALENALLAVDPDIDTSTIAGNFLETLQLIADEVGATSLMSEETATSTVAALQGKADALIQELDDYRNEYNRIVEQIYKDGNTPTEAELEKINELLEQIAEVKTRLQLLGDQAVAYAMATADLVKAGHGDADAFATALGFNKEQFDQARVDLESRYMDLMATEQQLHSEMMATLDADSQEAADELARHEGELARISTENAASIAALKDPYVQGIVELFDGIAQQYPESAAVLEDAVANYDLLSNINQRLSQEALSKSDYESIFTPEILKEMFGIEVEDVGHAFDSGMLHIGHIDALKQKAEKDLAENMTALEENPLAELLSASIESGNLDDLANADMSSVTGALEGLLKLLDFKDSANEVGTSMMEGVTAGVESGASDVDAAVETAAGGFLDSAKRALGIQSPSTEFKEIGSHMMEGTREGIEEGAEDVNTALSEAAETFVTTAETELAAEKFQEFGGFIMEGIKTGIEEGAEEATDAFTTATETFTSAAEAEFAAEKFQEYGTNITSGIGEGIASSQDAIIAPVQELAALMPAEGTALVEGLGDGVTAGIPLLLDIIIDLGTQIDDGAAAYQENMPTHGEAVSSNLASGISSGITVVMESIEAIGALLETTANAYQVNMPTHGLAVSTKLASGITSGQGLVVASMDQLRQQIENQANAYQVNMPTHGLAVSTKLASGITSGTGSVSSAMQQLGSIINNVAQTFPNNMPSIGQQIVGGIIQGINNNSSRLADAMRKMAEDAVKSAQSALQIESPSKVMEEVGEMTARGFAGGVNKNTHLAEQATEEMALAAILGASGAGGASGTENGVAPVQIGPNYYYLKDKKDLYEAQRATQRLAQELGQE